MNTYKLSNNERFELVMECRRSGLSDHQWCEEHGISTNTMYRWIRNFRKNGYPDIPASTSACTAPAVRQQAVKVNVVPDTHSNPAYFRPECISDNAVEIIRNDTMVRISNSASPQLVDVILRHMGASL